MNDMTDAQISKALALAIGYRPEDVRTAPDACKVVEVNRPCIYGDSWYRFDYDSPDVIWRVAEHYAMFPQQTDEGWHVTLSDWLNNRFSDTAAKAVALAVIAAHGG
jgi:hypothetical protein